MLFYFIINYELSVFQYRAVALVDIFNVYSSQGQKIEYLKVNFVYQ